MNDLSKRFLCAHEIGHAVLHAGENTYDVTRKNKDTDVEYEANLFAIGFMFPLDNVFDKSVFDLYVSNSLSPSIIPPIIVSVTILLTFLFHRFLFLPGLPRAVLLADRMSSGTPASMLSLRMDARAAQPDSLGLTLRECHILEALLAGFTLAHIVNARI